MGRSHSQSPVPTGKLQSPLTYTSLHQEVARTFGCSFCHDSFLSSRTVLLSVFSALTTETKFISTVLCVLLCHLRCAVVKLSHLQRPAVKGPEEFCLTDTGVGEEQELAWLLSTEEYNLLEGHQGCGQALGQVSLVTKVIDQNQSLNLHSKETAANKTILLCNWGRTKVMCRNRVKTCQSQGDHTQSLPERPQSPAPPPAQGTGV